MIDWNKIYDKLIKTCLDQILVESGYYETHHILPKHMGGTDVESNLVKMTTKQHVMAHYILYRIYKNNENKLAYLMKSGQTDEGNKLRVELAVNANRTYGNGFKLFSENNPMKDPICVQKALATKREKYGSTIVSETHYQNICKANRDSEQNKQKQKKRKVTLRNTIDNMTDDERRQKYGRFGNDNHWYGKKRPGKLAGNYGKSKGYYELIDTNGIIIKFDSFTELRKETGLDEGWIKRNRNKGVYTGPKNELNGFELRYFENKEYGKKI